MLYKEMIETSKRPMMSLRNEIKNVMIVRNLMNRKKEKNEKLRKKKGKK